jgi:hypothetical protein
MRMRRTKPAYASLGRKPNSKQPALVQAPSPSCQRAARSWRVGCRRRGGILLEVVRQAVASVATKTGRTEQTFKAHLPAWEGEDSD